MSARIVGAAMRLLAASLLAVTLVAATLLAPTLLAQGTHPVTGRRIAGVMSAGGADWLERPERESEEEPDKALDAIGLGEGMSVADVGAGTGYFAMRMARRVGPSGRVWATDLQPRMLELLRRNLAREKLTNVETVLGVENESKLPAGALDLILLVDVYHEFSEPQKMLRSLRAALKPDGRLVLLEYRKEDPDVPIRFEHKMSVDEVRTELEAEGFRLDQVIGVLKRQHILVLRKKT